MLATRLGFGLLGLVTAATISVTPVMAQKPCYLPDGTMYVGVQPPADCSTTRPKSRDEALQKAREEGAQRSHEEASKATAGREARIQDEAARRVMSQPLSAYPPPGTGWTFRVYQYVSSTINGKEYVRLAGELYWTPLMPTYKECERERTAFRRLAVTLTDPCFAR
jgi:hypothetical protein